MRQSCTQFQCERPAFGRGLCSAHYQRAKYHDQLPQEQPTRECAHCGQIFKSRKWNAFYCSSRCNDAARYQRKREAKGYRADLCEHCGIVLPDDRRLDTRFCSVKCGQDWRNARTAEQRLASKVGRVCRGCGGAIPAERVAGAVYCSDSCKIRSRRHEAYGLSRAELDLLLAQHDHCAICQEEDWGRKGPQVDHDHETGQVRGILCGNCNQGLGRFGDDPKRLRAAARYLERL